MKRYLFLVPLLALYVGGSAYSQELKLGGIPIAHELPLHAAIANGYLKDEGIKVELQWLTGQPAISAMVGGSVQAVQTAYISVFMARDAGLDTSILYPYARHSSGRDPDAVMVTTASGLTRAKDLEGKAVALVTRRSIAWVYFAEWMTLRGANPQKVQIVELPFPQMVPQLRAGTIQGAVTTEPFVAAEMEQGGVKIIERHFTAVHPQVEVSGLIATEKWLKANQALAERLVRALRKGTDYVNANPQSWPGLLASYARIKPEMVKKIVMPVWYYPIDVGGLQVQSDLALKWGLIKTKQDVRHFVWPTALK